MKVRPIGVVACLVAMTAMLACGGSSGATQSGSGAAKAAQSMAALKAKVKGKTLHLGFGSPPNLAEVTSVEITQILKDQFGVNVDYKPLAADVEAAGVMSGSLDAGEVSLARLAGLKQGGADPLVFESNDYQNDYVVAAKAPIKSMGDLKGKTWVDGGTTGPIALYTNACFQGTGITLSDTKAVHLASTGAATTAFATPQYEVAMIHADGLATLQAKFPNQYNAICYVYQKVTSANDVWYATRAWVQQNPDLTQAIAAAALLAARWTYANRSQWVSLAGTYVANLPDGVAAATYDLYATKIHLWDVNGALSMDNCAKAINDLVTVKALTSAVDCGSFVTLDYQTQARALVGAAKEPTPPPASS